ncbi:MAG: PorP/SprF family type IX secretion system membrane protein [Bacteroidales bacterium]|nr:PorP/SprF family type IX secretion system membrane protein [Bacteroidales bacterium]
MKKFLFSIIIFLSISIDAFSQFDAQFTQYWGMMSYYNPAVAGNSKYLRVNAATKLQWVGKIKNAPNAFVVNADMPLKLFKRQHGIGVALFSEGLGLFNNVSVGLQYAYIFKLFDGTLSIGIQPGLFNQSFDGSKVEIPSEGESNESNDEAIPTTQVQGMAFDINMGVYYTSSTLYGGIGVMHLTEPSIRLVDRYGTFVARSYNLTLGYNIRFNESLFELQPSTFLKTTFQFFAWDVQAKLVYNKMFWGGLNWRMNESVSLFLGAKIKSIRAGYAYDLPTSTILKGSSGSHELFVSYELDLSIPKGSKNKHKSIRIL